MSAYRRLRPRYSFAAKIGLAAGLVLLADALFYGHKAGFTLGAYGLALTVAAGLAGRMTAKDRRAIVATIIAAALALAMMDQPKFITLLMFSCSLGVAVMSPRARAGDDAWQWLQKLIANGVLAAIHIFMDARRVFKASPHRAWNLSGWRRAGLTLILPTGGGALFLWLFATANPLIDQALRRAFSIEFDWRLDVARGLFWLLVLVVAWGYMRPWMLRRTISTPGGEGDLKLPGVTVSSVSMALVTFNLLFALQNGLDIVFLWSGAGLPDGVTLAEYAHRGAYPLIATALLAGLFVLVALAPGSATSRSKPIRWLVVLWVAQNIMLVASTMLRTVDYIEVYSLTRLRIAALAWMALVAIGLALICWRMLRAKSSSWLINANVLAAGSVLAACTVDDLGALAARWNIEHAAEVGGRGTNLDLCYLNELGPSAMVAVALLEQRSLPPELAERVTWLRDVLARDLALEQSEWRSWTWRGARRLSAAQGISAGGKPYGDPLSEKRQCDGTVIPPDPPEPAPAPSFSAQGSLQFPSPDAADYPVPQQAPLTSSQPR